MPVCPICYDKIEETSCDKCQLYLTQEEMFRLKAKTYDSIISHLLQSGIDDRRREQARCKIALRNIKKWAEQNIPKCFT